MNRKSNPLSDRKRLGGYSILFVSLAVAAAGLLVLAFDALETVTRSKSILHSTPLQQKALKRTRS